MVESRRIIRRARRYAGLTQRELAERTGVSQPNVSDYETGRRQPTMPTLQRLIAAAGHRLVVRAVPGGAPYTLAEIAVHLAEYHELPCPTLTRQPERFADRSWFLSEHPSARAEGFATAPASFRRRGLFVGRHELEAA